LLRDRVYCSGVARAAILLASTLVCILSCSKSSPPAVRRIAVVRFENLTGDDSLNWMGRAVSEVVSAELAGSGNTYVIPYGTLRALGRVLGSRPAAAPGISAERPAAMVAGASHIVCEDLAHAVPGDATVVLYADGGSTAARAWMLLHTRGHQSVLVLREGLYEWIGRVLEPRLASDATAAERAAFARAAETSRFFGGIPLTGVPRAEVATGYWTGIDRSGHQPAGMSKRAIASIRRRGC